MFFRITVRVLLTLPSPGVTVSPIEMPRGVGNRYTVIQWQSPILSPAARQYTGARLTRSLCILGTSLKTKQCLPQGNQTLSQDKDDGNLQGGRGEGASGFTDSVPGVQAPLNRSQLAQKWYSRGGHCLILVKFLVAKFYNVVLRTGNTSTWNHLSSTERCFKI